MSISGIGGSTAVYTGLGTSRGRMRTASSVAPPPAYTRPLGDVWASIDKVSSSIEALLKSPLVTTVRTRLRPTLVTGDALGLSHSVASSPLVSTEEVNTETSSFGNRGWKIASTSNVDVTGLYDGSNGNGKVDFKAPDQDSTLSETQSVTFTVTVGGDTPTTYTQEVFANDPFELMGMTFEFGPGTIDRKDTLTVDFSGKPGTIRSNKPFDGVGKDGANLEQGYTVVDGSFALNGVSIDVAASDSIDGVVDRINASAAGVTANWSQSAEVFELTSNSGGLIEIGSDTSGFLAAMKLDGATFSQYDAVAVGDLAALSIQSGFFSIGGTTFNVDASADSLSSLLDQINAAGLDVTASYDSGTGRVSLSGTEAFALGDGTSGFFSALGIDVGAYGGATQRSGPPKVDESDAAEFRKQVAKFASALDEMVKATDGVDADVRSGVLGLLRGAVSDTFEAFGVEQNHGTFRSSVGLEFHLSELERRPSVDFDGTDLRDALSESPQEVVDFFFDDQAGEDDDGLLVQLRRAVERSRSKVRARALSQGPGSLVSTFA